jgi:hypothetical protein
LLNDPLDLRPVTLGCCLLATALAAAAVGRTAAAETLQLPQLHTNEAYVEEVTRETTLAVNDPMAVFAYVLGSLPARVKVYPTENYYYFSFIHNGTRYAGNIRLATNTGDEGKLIFAYYEDTEWRNADAVKHVILEGSHGIRVEKLEPLVYRVAYREKSVVFALNDLSQVRPPVNAIGRDETFVGPIFDESAIRFFLLYNSKLKLFHYILDETVRPADTFARAVRTDRILIGKRTGFAFYRDHQRERKILIGVLGNNQRANNYFDGPFDQLPDNFLEGDTLRRMILQVDPGLTGQIDRFGGSFDGSIRYVIAPYMAYDGEDELYAVHKCAEGRKRAAAYYKCFVMDEDASSDPTPARKLRRPSSIK